MSKPNQPSINRRDVLKSSAGALGAALVLGDSLEAYPKKVNTNSSPSALRITDLRVATIVKPGPSPCPIIRVDTNQGVYGLGEVRDGASATYALFLKNRILGENPLQLDKIFRKIKQFGGPARQAGGVCAIEMALWDIAGKVYNAPVYAMVGGGKFRDKIRVYADTTESKDPKVYAQRMRERKEGMGITWLKMDLGIEMVSDTPGTVTEPSELSPWEMSQLEHPFLAMEVTDKGIAMLEQYESPTPILTGEDIYLKEPFRVLCEKHAVSKIHPDLATSGGVLETHKIGNMAEEYGVPMAMHFAGTPVSCMANVHCAAATLNFLALENHSLDVPWWSSMVEEGVKTPIVEHGWITVPDRPGLGVTLNDEVVRQHLMPGTGYFEPTPQWDQERSWDRLWS